MLDIIREMVMAVDKLEKRLEKVETPKKTSKPELVLPPLLPPTQLPHIPSALLIVGMYEMLAPMMPMGAPFLR